MLTLDNQVHFLDEKSRDSIGHWLYRRWHHCHQKKRDANNALSRCTVEEGVLRAEWAAQVQEQTKPLTRELAHYYNSINIA